MVKCGLLVKLNDGNLISILTLIKNVKTKRDIIVYSKTFNVHNYTTNLNKND